jgi:hypothetical protein
VVILLCLVLRGFPIRCAGCRSTTPPTDIPAHAWACQQNPHVHPTAHRDGLAPSLPRSLAPFLPHPHPNRSNLTPCKSPSKSAPPTPFPYPEPIVTLATAITPNPPPQPPTPPASPELHHRLPVRLGVIRCAHLPHLRATQGWGTPDFWLGLIGARVGTAEAQSVCSRRTLVDKSSSWLT